MLCFNVELTFKFSVLVFWGSFMIFRKVQVRVADFSFFAVGPFGQAQEIESQVCGLGPLSNREKLQVGRCNGVPNTRCSVEGVWCAQHTHTRRVLGVLLPRVRAWSSKRTLSLFRRAVAPSCTSCAPGAPVSLSVECSCCRWHVSGRELASGRRISSAVVLVSFYPREESGVPTGRRSFR